MKLLQKLIVLQIELHWLRVKTEGFMERLFINYRLEIEEQQGRTQILLATNQISKKQTENSIEKTSEYLVSIIYETKMRQH